MRLTRALALIPFVTAGVAIAAPEQYQVNGDHAQVVFDIDHFGYSHTHGSFKKISGTLAFDEQKPEASKVTILIKTASLDTGFAARDKDVLGTDLLDGKKYPEIRFVSTKVAKTGTNTFAITGDLTLHGQTKPVTFNATLNKSAPDAFEQKPTVGFTASSALKRSDFGIAGYLPDVGDQVRFTIDTEFQAPKK
jgi:polyisoprenoid-binding protein YceI